MAKISRHPNTDPNPRLTALNNAINAIAKQFGEGSLFRLGSNEARAVNVIRSGSLALDRALGVGGYPLGGIVEVFGPESSGKTTLTLTAIAQAQQRDHYCAFIDAEHALDPSWAQTLGVDTDNLWVSQPDHGEAALEIADKLVRSHAVGLIVIDSVATLTPKAEIEGDMGDPHVGVHARLMSQALRKINANANQTGTTVLFVNQIRHQIGVSFGSPETTTGGNALKFYATHRLDIRRTGSVKAGSDNAAIGNHCRVKVVKNKVAPPFRQAEFEIRFDQGIDTIGELIDLGVAEGFVQKSGAWYSYDGQRIGQGRENVRKYLIEHPDQAAALRSQLEATLLPRFDAPTDDATGPAGTV